MQETDAPSGLRKSSILNTLASVNVLHSSFNDFLSLVADIRTGSSQRREDQAADVVFMSNLHGRIACGKLHESQRRTDVSDDTIYEIYI